MSGYPLNKIALARIGVAPLALVNRWGYHRSMKQLTASFASALALAVLIAAPIYADINYRDEVFSWVWMPCMYQIAEDQGASVGNIDEIALQLHSEMEGGNFNRLAWDTEKAVKGMPVEERAEAYRYLRNECAGGYVASDYLPTWKLGEPPF